MTVLQNAIDDLTADFVRSCLDYDPDTGSFTWKRRKDVSNVWNGRYAGKSAGCTAKTGYVLIAINNRLMKAHRLAWVIVHGEWPKGVIDHINGAPGDNRIANLRCVTQGENMRNQKRNTANKSGYKGVSYFARDGKWMACIRLNKKTKYLGYYHTPEEAHTAYCDASRKVHGDFGRTQ